MDLAVCVLRIQGDTQSTECLLISKYMLFVCSGGYVSYWDMQNDEKCKNDNLLSDQVLVLLMFSNGRECEQ